MTVVAKHRTNKRNYRNLVLKFEGYYLLPSWLRRPESPSLTHGRGGLDRRQKVWLNFLPQSMFGRTNARTNQNNLWHPFQSEAQSAGIGRILWSHFNRTQSMGCWNGTAIIPNKSETVFFLRRPDTLRAFTKSVCCSFCLFCRILRTSSNDIFPGNTAAWQICACSLLHLGTFLCLSSSIPPLLIPVPPLTTTS